MTRAYRAESRLTELVLRHVTDEHGREAMLRAIGELIEATRADEADSVLAAGLTARIDERRRA